MTKIGDRITRTVEEDGDRDDILIFNALDVGACLAQYRHYKCDKSYYAGCIQAAIRSVREESKVGAKRLEKYVREYARTYPDLEIKDFLDELAD